MATLENPPRKSIASLNKNGHGTEDLTDLVFPDLHPPGRPADVPPGISTLAWVILPMTSNPTRAPHSGLRSFVQRVQKPHGFSGLSFNLDD